MTRPSLIVVVPIAPAETGNGLAMRAHLLVEAAGRDHDVHLVVVPVAGHQPAPPSYGSGTASVVHAPVDEPGPPVRWLSDPRWRERFEALSPVPAAVLAAPPGLTEPLCAGLPSAGVAAVCAMRLSLGPLGLALSETLQVPLILDADDDDADYFRQSDEPDEARAWKRVAQLCLPASALVTAASATVATALTARHRLDRPVRVVPNGVHVPDDGAAGEGIEGRPAGRLLVVANFTYPPNIDGAQWLVREVLPLLGPNWRLDLVGAAGPDVQALAAVDVTVHGWVSDVEAHYAVATVAAVPVRFGSGTRIKLLEAMAHGCPVVTTTAGAAGLAIRPGVHALAADEPGAFADAVHAAGEPAISRPLVVAASRLVREQYDASAVINAAADLLADITHP